MELDKWKDLIKMSAKYQNQDFWGTFVSPENSSHNKKHSFSGLEQEKISRFLSNQDIYPRCDMYEYNGNIKIEAELPGVCKNDIKVSLLQNELIIKGKCSSFHQHLRYFLKERHSRSFEKVLTLPMPVDKYSIESSFENGILSISLPILFEEEEIIQIFVKSEEKL
ncbi:Hsp20/alpha crystallin family protein [Cytobacillus oceanisediminis]|uniref:Hsp20/alpha crystallin family protein n=1 Tax=Cytobacillus oceanisediminis TaxID=665099 RepID=UPI0023D98069|nr:Hsp20/alpha crystallin family protein [Cytobacillus oceanisediminis]MDF2035406.1 Hsp20/alpha crystallin family protein [Cytobacillus oceanisediminis]